MVEDLTFTQLGEAVERVPQPRRGEVATLSAQARAYVWGWQDAGRHVHDSDVATRFAIAYGIHAARYAAGTIGHRHNIQGAWTRWTAGHPIEEQPAP